MAHYIGTELEHISVSIRTEDFTGKETEYSKPKEFYEILDGVEWDMTLIRYVWSEILETREWNSDARRKERIDELQTYHAYIYRRMTKGMRRALRIKGSI